MFLFLLGAICGAIIGVVFVNAKPQGTKNNTSTQTDTPRVQGTAVTQNGEDKRIVNVDIPIEALSNIYSLSIQHPTVKYIKEKLKDGRIFEHISIDCELHYKLNGRKEGKRHFVFSYYDQNGNVVSHSETTPYRLTDTGMEIVHIEHYVPWGSIPQKIGVSVREVPDGRFL